MSWRRVASVARRPPKLNNSRSGSGQSLESHPKCASIRCAFSSVFQTSLGDRESSVDMRDELTRYRSDRLRENEELSAIASLLLRIKGSDLASLANAILADREQLETTRRYAYRHVNGFSKVTLLKTNSLCLRVHLWNEISAPAENIHSHKWVFASRVMAGKIAESRYTIADPRAALSATEFAYSKAPEALTGSLLAVRDVPLLDAGRIEHQESTLYTAGTADIHRVHAQEASEPLASLVLTGRSRRRVSKVYAEIGAVPIADRNDANLDQGDTVDLLRHIKDIAS